MPDFSNFLDVQTKTGWGRTLADFASFCNPQPASRILDIGCGPGLLPAIFAHAEHTALGVDFDFKLLSSSLTSNLIQADANHLPFQPSTFNLITSTNVLFLLENPVHALQAWKSVIAPDGQLCLLNPSENMSIATATHLADERGLDGTARQSLLNWAHNAETHARWTEVETRALLAQGGFQLEESVLCVGPGFARYTRAKPC